MKQTVIHAFNFPVEVFRFVMDCRKETCFRELELVGDGLFAFSDGYWGSLLDLGVKMLFGLEKFREGGFLFE